MKLIKPLIYVLIANIAICSCKKDDSDVKVTSVKVTTQSFTLTNAGDSKTLDWSIMPSNATNTKVSWQSRNTQVASVDQTGKVVAVSDGSTYIAINTADGNKRDSVMVIVDITPATPLLINKAQNSVVQGESLPLNFTSKPQEVDDQKLTWISRNTSIATVSNYGVVSAVSVGSTYIVAQTSDAKHKDSVQITVVARPVTGVSINEEDFSIAKGATKQLTYIVTPDNATNKEVSWRSLNTSVATVDNNGLVAAVGVGNAYIVVMTADGGLEDRVLITVEEPVTGISISPENLSIFVGYTSQLSYSIEPSNATNKVVKWSSSNPSVATVSENGLVTAVAVGSTQITATTVSGSKQASAAINVLAANISGTYPGKLKGRTSNIPIAGAPPAQDIDQDGNLAIQQYSPIGAELKIAQTIEGLPIDESINCSLAFNGSKVVLNGFRQITIDVPANGAGIPEGEREVKITILNGVVNADGTVNIPITIETLVEVPILGAQWIKLFNGTFTGVKQ